MIESMKSQRRRKDLTIEGKMAYWYNRNARKHRIGEMQGYAALLARDLKTGATVLELAPGPGYLAIELAKLGSYQITGLELSRTFVEIARTNAMEAGVEVDFCQGNAADIPFSSNSFDALVCTAAFKNFRDPVTVLHEMYRVLKAGGSALIVDMNPHATNRQIREYMNKMDVRGFNALFMKFMFRWFLRHGAYTREEFAGLFAATGWSAWEIREEEMGYTIRLEKA